MCLSLCVCDYFGSVSLLNQEHFLSMMTPKVHAHSYSYSYTHSTLDTLVKCGMFLCLLSPCLRPPLSCHHFFSQLWVLSLWVLWWVILQCEDFICISFSKPLCPVGRAYQVPVLVVITMNKFSIVCLPLVYYNQILLTKMPLNFNL